MLHRKLRELWWNHLVSSGDSRPIELETIFPRCLAEYILEYDCPLLKTYKPDPRYHTIERPPSDLRSFLIEELDAVLEKGNIYGCSGGIHFYQGEKENTFVYEYELGNATHIDMQGFVVFFGCQCEDILLLCLIEALFHNWEGTFANFPYLFESWKQFLLWAKPYLT